MIHFEGIPIYFELFQTLHFLKRIQILQKIENFVKVSVLSVVCRLRAVPQGLKFKFAKISFFSFENGVCL